MKPRPSAEALRRAVLCEWRGCDEPVRSTDNVVRAGEFIDRILARTGSAHGVNEARLGEAWRALAGDAIASHCEPESLKDGELRLRVLQPSMRFHLEQIKPLLLRKLRAEFGEDAIRTVRFVVG